MTEYNQRHKDIIYILVAIAAIIAIMMSLFHAWRWLDLSIWDYILVFLSFIVSTGGLTAALFTRQHLRAQETKRRLLAENEWFTLPPVEFELYVATLFHALGYRTRTTGYGTDGGIDIWVEREGIAGIVQCKQYTDQKIDTGQLQEFAHLIPQKGVQEGYFVTTTHFTDPAQQWAETIPLLFLIDNDTLAMWMKIARQGPYRHPLHNPLFFGPGQWLILTLSGILLLILVALLLHT